MCHVQAAKGKEEEMKYVAVALTDAPSGSSVRSTRSCPKRSEPASTSPALTSAFCRHCRPAHMTWSGVGIEKYHRRR